MSKILVILGSTSTGKTDLALNLAKRFNGELVACDSRQVYRGLDIATGKLPGKEVTVKKEKWFWELDGIKIWMYDVVDPKKQYTVYDYVKDAGRVIDNVWERGKLPIIVGGTGFYLKAVLEGLPNLAIPVDKDLRKKLEKFSKEQLQKKLQQISPDKWESLNTSDRQNPRRLIRAIELSISSLRGAKRRSNLHRIGKIATLPLVARDDMLKIGLTAPREILYQRIDERVVRRIDQGMIDEARRLQKDGLSLKRMKQLGLEYGVLADYLKGKITSAQELIKLLEGKIHGYARRQLTWFKKEKDVSWFNIIDKHFPNGVEKIVSKWYYYSDAAKS